MLLFLSKKVTNLFIETEHRLLPKLYIVHHCLHIEGRQTDEFRDFLPLPNVKYCVYLFYMTITNHNLCAMLEIPKSKEFTEMLEYTMCAQIF